MITTNRDYHDELIKEVIRLRLSQLLLNEEYKINSFKVPVHLALGHEAIAVAVSGVMQDRDALLPTHRNIAYNLARAGSLRPILDEYRLRSSGLGGGAFGSMNLINPHRGIPYTSSILGGQFAVATGLAMAKKINGEDGVVIVLAGDGSIEEGSFYESMLMARTFNLAVIFLVENNGWSMATHINERRSQIDVALLAEALDVRYVQLEGNDVYEYAKSMKEIRLYSISQQSPVCIEVGVFTLGDRRTATSAEYPEGRIINYHSGPATEISQVSPILIKKNYEDPIFVLREKMGIDNIEEMVAEELKRLHKELL